MNIKQHKSKETCFPNIAQNIYIYFRIWHIKREKNQHISDNILKIINKSFFLKKLDIPFKCYTLSISLNQIQLSMANNKCTFGKIVLINT